MSVLAIFTYDVKPGRLGDFTAKLKKAADSKFDSKVMPKGIRFFRSSVPGPDTGPVILMIEYENMAENSNSEWKELFAAKPDSAESLVSVQLLTEMAP
jgi:hypothetical protein